MMQILPSHYSFNLYGDATSILNDRLKQYSENQNIVNETQAGFREE